MASLGVVADASGPLCITGVEVAGTAGATVDGNVPGQGCNRLTCESGCLLNVIIQK